MDVMELRRGLLMQMASGARFVKGTFTVGSAQSNPYVIRFGETFSDYMYYIEMTDESKTELLNTGINASKTYALFGTSKMPHISEYMYSNMFLTYRIKPSSHATSYNGNSPGSFDETSLSLPCYAIDSSSTNALYRGYSYNYYIVEIK